MAKYLKMKPAKSNPLLNKWLMGLLGLFFVVSMILTLPFAAGYTAKALGVSEGDVRYWGKVVSSIAGGTIMIIVAAAFVGAPLIAGALVIAGIVGIGWGIWQLAKGKDMDVMSSPE